MVMYCKNIWQYQTLSQFTAYPNQYVWTPRVLQVMFRYCGTVFGCRYREWHTQPHSLFLTHKHTRTSFSVAEPVRNFSIQISRQTFYFAKHSFLGVNLTHPVRYSPCFFTPIAYPSLCVYNQSDWNDPEQVVSTQPAQTGMPIQIKESEYLEQRGMK
jgi:hypothetical protein